MSEESQLPGGVRRVGRKDRKRRLDPAAPLFSQDDDPSAEDEPPASPLPFDDLSASPDEVDAALRAVGELDLLTGRPRAPVDEPPLQAETAQAAGPEERFPPLHPDAPAPQPAPAQLPRKRGLAPQDKIAAFFFFATFLLLIWLAVVWNDPFSWANPFPRPTEFVVITATSPPQPQVTQAPLQAPVGGPTASFTPLIEVAHQGTDNSAAPTPGSSFSAGLTATPSAYPFAPAETGLIYIPNANGRGCNWSSIAGTVTGLQGEALDGYGVQIKGDDLDAKVFSGTAQTFGPGGFELFLNGVPRQARYVVRLLTAAGAPLSEEIIVITSDQCEQNVVLVNFVQQRAF